MKLGELLPNLSGVRKGGQGYVAKCPAHGDQRQSLSLAEISGRILMKCHAGCSTATIVSKLGIGWRDLFDNNIKVPSISSLGASRDRITMKPERHIEGVRYFSSKDSKVHCVYPYMDANGVLLYENVRFYPKDFRPRRYDVNGQAVWNLEGVRRVPYRLPEIAEAAKKNQDIFLCEGEKDADSMCELGFAASSFKNWNEEMNRYIEGSHVVIVQDHDQPGVTQANEAARVVLKSAASLKVLDIYAGQEMPEKHGRDISDYIMQCVQIEGMDLDAVKERICLSVERAENWKDPVPARLDEYFVVQSGNEWMQQAKTQPIPEKLFGEFWFENEICILFADTNVGKSILAVQIADAISRGMRAEGGGMNQSETHPSTLVPHPSNTVPAQKVVYFDFELTAKQFESRFSERQEGSDTFVNHYQFHRNFYRAEINPGRAISGSLRSLKTF